MKKPTKFDRKVKRVLTEYNARKLHSGSKEGKVVTNPKQALAIALSEARQVSRQPSVAKALQKRFSK